MISVNKARAERLSPASVSVIWSGSANGGTAIAQAWTEQEPPIYFDQSQKYAPKADAIRRCAVRTAISLGGVCQRPSRPSVRSIMAP